MRGRSRRKHLEGVPRDDEGPAEEVLVPEPESLSDLLGHDLPSSVLAERMGMSESEITHLEREVFLVEAQRIGRWNAEEIFVDYVVRTRARVRSLMRISDQARLVGEYAASVSAIKAAQDFHDRVLKRGSELGFVEPKKGGDPVGNLTLPQFRDLVVKELQEMTQLTSRYTDEPFEALPAADVTRVRPEEPEPAPVREPEPEGLPPRLIDVAEDAMMPARRDRVVRRAAR